MTSRSHFMPKPTFFNLPEEKRETIFNAAVEEFAEYGLEKASTNRIVKNSGIAKGSFYQYFEDKQDVFMHMLDVIEQKERDFFKDKPPPGNNMDTFHFFRWLIKTGMEFGLTHPRMVQAAWRILLGEGLLYGENFAVYREKSKQGLTELIKQAMARGEVDPSVDVELAVMIMETWSNAITTYFLQEGAKQKDMLKWMRSRKTQETIDKLLYVMEYGLRKTESEFVRRP
jgi:AcrR family transcriptional regulator